MYYHFNACIFTTEVICHVKNEERTTEDEADEGIQEYLSKLKSNPLP